MAIVKLAQISPSIIGSAVVPTALSTADDFTVSLATNTVLIIRHTVAASVATDNQITIVTPGTVEPNLAVADQVIPMAVGQTKVVNLAKLDRRFFANGATLTFKASGTDAAGMVAYAVDA